MGFVGSKYDRCFASSFIDFSFSCMGSNLEPDSDNLQWQNDEKTHNTTRYFLGSERMNPVIFTFYGVKATEGCNPSIFLLSFVLLADVQ